MKATIILLFAVTAIGIFLILCDLLKLPSMASTRAALNIAQNNKRHIHSFSAIQFSIAARLSQIIRIDEYKRRKMLAILKNADIVLTPETYTAQAIVSAGAIVLIAVPAFYIFPILAPIFVLKGLSVYFKKIHAADDIVQKKRDAIDSELPRFTATIAQELKTTHNVLGILEGYIQNAGPEFGRELKITAADMHSGSQISALARLDSRVNSRMLNDVVRGLLSTIRGDNSETYFTFLAENFKSSELQNLEKKAMKRPGKVNFYTGLMFVGGLIFIYVAVFIQVFFSSGAKLFGG